jgi:hypothetical protein
VLAGDAGGRSGAFSARALCQRVVVELAGERSVLDDRHRRAAESVAALEPGAQARRVC